MSERQTWSSREMLERAFAIAESGEVGSLRDLRQALYSEGFSYSDMAQYLAGTTVTRQLSKKLGSARRSLGKKGSAG